MREWAEEEFERAANSTRLGEKTVAACRDVLVGKMTGAAAADKHGILPPHVSRGIKVLTERRDALRQRDRQTARALQAREAAASVSGLLKAAAMEAARSIKGVPWVIRDAVAGQTYEGAGVVKVGGFLVQDIGRVGVIHDLKNVALEPELGKRLEIVYPKEGKAKVAEIPLDRGTRERGR